MRQLPPPSDFNTEARKLWSRAQAELRGQGTWRNTDAPLLEAYVRSIVRARAAHAAAAERPFVAGSKGQLAPHPAIRVARDAEADARAAAGALLLTPEARKRHEVGPPVEDEFASRYAIG
jgi:P27 family predicted phage terminase small subunit